MSPIHDPFQIAALFAGALLAALFASAPQTFLGLIGQRARERQREALVQLAIREELLRRLAAQAAAAARVDQER